ncbi:hypothetical protein [Ornithinimicrobium cryptoxanthini]|uniref:hypothetical protein n=1 Tax=Ornithinimicrobium cryptoxanthini TaxID=2934161 RepID=UPI002117BE7A|nr:hypothetical protein [Ornithinimicrobium cryptoxanthini]
MLIDKLTQGAVAGAVDEDMERRWLGAVHGSLRSVGGFVAGPVRPPGPGWNYYRVSVEADRTDVWVLLNAALGLVAACSTAGAAEVGPLRFVDVPGPGSYRQAGFTVADAVALSASLRPEHVTGLTDPQRADVRYHRPDAVGDLLFNWFD